MSAAHNYAASASENDAQAARFTVFTNTDQAVSEPAPAEPSLEPVGDPKDREIAAAVLRSLRALQDTLDAAAVAGLIVEPSFKKYPGRFKDRGSDAESYVAKVDVYRKLA